MSESMCESRRQEKLVGVDEFQALTSTSGIYSLAIYESAFVKDFVDFRNIDA